MPENKAVESPCPKSINAERLKAQGNALYGQTKFRAAYEKYSEAIKEDPKNPILWSNRAACSLALKEYLDAAADAQKAVQLDPRYAKAWSRLATAFSGIPNWSKSINAWKTALSCLPTKEVSEQEKLLKTQFEAGLAQAEAAQKGGDEHNKVNVRTSSTQDAPWNRALAMEKEMAGQVSSAWVIMNAFRDFQYGLEALRNQERQVVGSRVIGKGSWGALADLSNGILRDYRVFHVSDADFFDRYNDQVDGESQMSRAWKTGGPKQVKEEAPKRLKKSSWDDLRMALATTVRAWIMAGFFENTINGIPTPEFYRNAIEVLDWGRCVWKDVPRDSRGPIFDLTFVRGVKRLYLKTVMEKYSAGQNSGLSLDEIADLARDMIEDVRSNPYDVRTAAVKIDPGFWQSFWPYPEGEALATLGWYYMKLASSEEDLEIRRKHYLCAAAQYNEASNCFACDDEYRPYYRKMALEGLWWAGLPLSITLEMCRRIKTCLPAVRKIWEHSPLSSKFNRHMEQVLTFETDYQDRIEQGEAKLTDVACPFDITPILTDTPANIEFK